MRAVKVYGQLAERLGQRVFRADVASPAEAIRFLCVNFPGLEQWLIDSEQDGVGYRVKVSKTDIGYDDMGMNCNPDATISITPVLAGAGGGTGQILAGVGLIAAAIVLGPAAGGFLGLGAGLGGATGAGAALSFGLVGGGFASAIGFAGVAMVLSGTASLLTPSASLTNPAAGIRASRNAAALQSYNFTGIQNTSIQGTPIPLVYGKIYTGSITISAGIATTEI